MKEDILKILHKFKLYDSTEDGYHQTDLIFDDGSFELIADEIIEYFKTKDPYFDVVTQWTNDLIGALDRAHKKIKKL